VDGGRLRGIEDLESIFKNFLSHSMNPPTYSRTLLAKRPQLSRYVMLLVAVECLALVALSLLAPLEQSWTKAGCALMLLGVSYYFAYQGYTDRVLSWLLSGSLILTTSLLLLGAAGLPGAYNCQYGQIVTLAVIAFYRNRRLSAAAAGLSVAEQLLRRFLSPDLQPAPPSLLFDEHICWLAAAGFLFAFFCQAGPSALAADRQPAPAESAGETPPQAVGELSGNLESLSELRQLATEVGAQAGALNQAIANLGGPLARMVQSINGANKGMEDIRDELSRTAASVEQITRSSEMHAVKASEVFQSADEAADGSQIGARSTEESIRNMDQVREQMNLIAQSMDNLLTRSQKMVQVVGLADELALQSKVLSVNAAIEAAKAGDQGKGFTAVATEVKSLAIQSKEATREVRQILKEIQKSIADMRGSISLGNRTVDLASKQCRSTAESIKGLDERASSSRDAAEAIMVSSKEQAQGIMQISHAMSDIQIVTEQNSDSLGSLQDEARNLSAIARGLLDDMASYQALTGQLLSRSEALSKKESGN
jgi:methyl-accepting chemotaxis protein